MEDHLVVRAESPNVTEAELRVLENSYSEAVQTAIGLNPNCPRDLLERLIKKAQYLDGIGDECRRHLLKNPSVTTELLEQFCFEEDDERIFLFALQEVLPRWEASESCDRSILENALSRLASVDFPVADSPLVEEIRARLKFKLRSLSDRPPSSGLI